MASHVSNGSANHSEELERARVLVEISASTAEAVPEDSVAAAPVVMVKVSRSSLVFDR
jgi:hypothetical protein